MKTLHIDTPRGISFTIKGWEEMWHLALGGSQGKNFQQHDLNPDFWYYLLDNEESSLFDRIIDFQFQESVYNTKLTQTICQLLNSKSSNLCNFDLAGYHFSDQSKNSLSTLTSFVRNNSIRHLFLDFFKQLNKKYMLLSGYSIISLGIDSLDGLVFAALLADYIHRHNKYIHVCLGRHQYENFSLLKSLNDKTTSTLLLDLFDSVVLYKELTPEALVGLRKYLQTEDQYHLNNILVRVEGHPQFFKPNADKPSPEKTHQQTIQQEKGYLLNALIPLNRLVYLMPLIGNSCYHGKCSFCVQNKRNIAPDFFDNKKKIQHALDRIMALTNKTGKIFFSFSDQAIAPALLRQFSKEILSNKIKINWCVRMLFDTNLNQDLINLLRDAGCTEVLFGLESCNPETLKKMKKAKTDFSESKALTLLQKFQDSNIDVCLNFIHTFPSESESQFHKTTWDFFIKCSHRFTNISYIFNKFTLFPETDIANNPDQYGIQCIFQENIHFPLPIDYVDNWGRKGSEEYSPAKFSFANLGKDFGALSSTELSIPAPLRAAIIHLHHSTIGLTHRSHTADFLADSLCSAYTTLDKDTSSAIFASNVTWRKNSDLNRKVLLLGCNSYLGQNLASSLDEHQLILSSRNYRNEICQNISAPFVKEDLTKSINNLSAIKPENVFIVSRPLEQDFFTNQLFSHNLKLLLMKYVANKITREITFISTQLVYATPETPTPIASNHQTQPENIYEYFKLDLEMFLAFLARKFNIKVRIYRIPLLVGGLILPHQRKTQLLYQWLQAYCDGHTWNCPSNKEIIYGNSWLDMNDFTSLLKTNEGMTSYKISHVSSGDFSYFDLGEIFKELLPSSIIADQKASLPLIKSHFFLKDDSGLPQGNLKQLINTIIHPMQQNIESEN